MQPPFNRLALYPSAPLLGKGPRQLTEVEGP